MRTLFAIALLCASLSLSVATMDKVLLADAWCLDSTRAGYYIREGDPSLWVIFLEGGGACYTQHMCDERIKTDLGSSKSWQDTISSPQNVLSDDPSVNPDFSKATAVYVPYCTGDVHAGTRVTPSPESWGLRFSGHSNFEAIFRNLTARYSLDEASDLKILLSGASAGGFGTFNNVDWLAAQLPDADVRGAPQGGFFFPGNTAGPPSQPSWQPPSVYPLWVKGQSGGLLSNASIVNLYQWYLNPACAAAHSADTAFQCATVAEMYQYLKSPMFIMENQADTNQLFVQLQVPKIKDSSTLAYVSYFVWAMRNSTSEVTKKPKDAGFIPACYDHTSGLNVGGTTSIDGVTSGPMLGDFFFDRPMKTRFLMDACNGSPLPCNPTCTNTFPARLSEDAIAERWA